MAIVVVHQEAESGSRPRHIKVIGPMQHDADVNQARLLPPGGASRVSATLVIRRSHHSRDIYHFLVFPARKGWEFLPFSHVLLCNARY